MHQPVVTGTGRLDRKVRAAVYSIRQIVRGLQASINHHCPPKLFGAAPAWNNFREEGYTYSVLFYLLLVLQLQLQVTWCWLDNAESTDYAPYQMLRPGIRDWKEKNLNASFPGSFVALLALSMESIPGGEANNILPTVLEKEYRKAKQQIHQSERDKAAASSSSFLVETGSSRKRKRAGNTADTENSQEKTLVFLCHPGA